MRFSWLVCLMLAGCVGRARPRNVPVTLYEGTPTAAAADRVRALPPLCNRAADASSAPDVGLALHTDPQGARLSVWPRPPGLPLTEFGYAGVTPCTLQLPPGEYWVRLDMLHRKPIEVRVVRSAAERIETITAALPEALPGEYNTLYKINGWAGVLFGGAIGAGFTWATWPPEKDDGRLLIAGLGWGLALGCGAVLWRLYHPTSAEVREHLFWPAPTEGTPLEGAGD